MKKPHRITAFVGCLSIVSMLGGAASAGPVIIGGDDMQDHGSYSAGVNVNGWLYLELAIKDLYATQTRAGAFTSDIVALGSSDSAVTSSNGGAAIHYAAQEQPVALSVDYINGGAALTQFFVDLANGTKNPAVIWIAGTGVSNDLDGAEAAALLANANALDGFVTSGGGLFSHGSEYAWLTALIPGINTSNGCNASGATLTAAGNATLPTLTNSDIRSGPCHNSFSGNLGGLSVLALDGNQTPRNMIIGGLITSQGGGIGGNPVPEPSMLGLFGLGLIGLGIARRRRSRK